MAAQTADSERVLEGDSSSNMSSLLPPTEPIPTIPINHLKNYKVFCFLPHEDESLLRKAKLAYVFGNTGIIVTTEDEVFSVGTVGGTNEQTVALTKVPALCGQNVKEFMAGSDGYCFALTEGGVVYSWGQNGVGQLGLGDEEPSLEPKIVNGDLDGKKIVKIAASPFFVLALGDNGSVYSWGKGSKGELGLGNKLTTFSPCVIVDSCFDKEIVSIAVARELSIGLSASGQVYQWGLDINIPRKIPAPAIFKKIVSGFYFVIALSDKGELYNVSRTGVLSKFELQHYAVDVAGDPKVHRCAVEFYHGISTDDNIGGDGARFDKATHFTSLDEAMAARGITYRTLTASMVKKGSVRCVDEDISRAWDNVLMNDVKFCIQGKTIGANKTILSLRSTYFEKMFSGQWKETSSDSGTIFIEDTKVDAFWNLLSYIYRDQLDISSSDYENIFDVMQLADSYCEFGIRRVCEEMLMRNITTDNALFLLQNAALANAMDLEDRVVQFVISHGKKILEICPNPGDLETKVGKEPYDRLMLAYLNQSSFSVTKKS